MANDGNSAVVTRFPRLAEASGDPGRWAMATAMQGSLQWFGRGGVDCATASMLRAIAVANRGVPSVARSPAQQIGGMALIQTDRNADAGIMPDGRLAIRRYLCATGYLNVPLALPGLALTGAVPAAEARCGLAGAIAIVVACNHEGTLVSVASPALPDRQRNAGVAGLGADGSDPACPRRRDVRAAGNAGPGLRHLPAGNRAPCAAGDRQRCDRRFAATRPGSGGGGVGHRVVQSWMAAARGWAGLGISCDNPGRRRVRRGPGPSSAAVR